MKTLLKKWHLLSLTLILVVTSLGIMTKPVSADAPPGNFLVTKGASFGTYVDFSIYNNASPHQFLYTYPGWCVDTNNHIYYDLEYPIIMLDYFGNYYPPQVDTLDSPQKERIKAIKWNAVAYVINHKVGSSNDIQTAIWYFTHNPIDPYFPLSLIHI